MERKRPYWQVAVSLVFSILATAAFIILGVKAIGFLMPFVVGWIISAIATPLVNWLEKRLKIVKKLGTAMIVIMVIGLIVLVGYFAVSRIAAEVTDLIQNFPDIYAQLEEGMREIGNTLSGAFSRLPGSAEWVDNDRRESGYLYGESCFENQRADGDGCGKFCKKTSVLSDFFHCCDTGSLLFYNPERRSDRMVS